jgi:hypothetical protein
MDPNAALDTILDNVMYFFLQESPDEGTPKRETHQEEYARLMEICENFNALHHWLMDGGFLPNKWKVQND